MQLYIICTSFFDSGMCHFAQHKSFRIIKLISVKAIALIWTELIKESKNKIPYPAEIVIALCILECFTANTPHMYQYKMPASRI